MKVEYTFGIKIPDREAEQILTVGDFHNAVWRHLSGKQSDKCKSQFLFYKLRKDFANTFGFTPHQLKLDTLSEEIFPKINRRLAYRNFAEVANLKLPALVLIKPWATVLPAFGFLTIVGGLAIAFILVNVLNFSNWVFLIPVAGFFMTYVFSYLLNPKRTAIKEITIREFTQHTLALNYSALVATEGTNRKEMETVINQIIADCAGLDFEEVTTEKKIADDLGID